jgi:hypothetical protein
VSAINVHDRAEIESRIGAFTRSTGKFSAAYPVVRSQRQRSGQDMSRASALRQPLVALVRRG